MFLIIWAPSSSTRIDIGIFIKQPAESTCRTSFWTHELHLVNMHVVPPTRYAGMHVLLPNAPATVILMNNFVPIS